MCQTKILAPYLTIYKYLINLREIGCLPYKLLLYLDD